MIPPNVDNVSLRTFKDDIVIVTGKETSQEKYLGESAPVRELCTMEVFVKQGNNGW